MEWFKRLETLKDLIKIQTSDGNWNYDPYMQGMANGMILAEAIMEEKEPVYKESPKKWLVDSKFYGSTDFQEIISKIVKRKNKYCVVSEKSGKNLGCSDTKEKAVKRLRQVEWFKRHK